MAPPQQNCHHEYLVPAILSILADLKPARVFDLGCGDGYVTNRLAQEGYSVIGCEPSHQGVRAANRYFPELSIFQGSTDEDLTARFGQFPVVLSVEVIEHVYDPHGFAKALYELVIDGGTAVISTPYHGYWKNLAISLANKWDQHHSPLWAHGHIKFWSEATLGQLLRETGFRSVRFSRCGRIRALAKSMIAVAAK
jgi:2-polyprenyl-6-hydroxyphenyl methylase/3-demethylubiquinone-9 3-methyltransferase